MRYQIILFIMCLSATAQLFPASICSPVNSPGLWEFGGSMIGDPTDPNDALICVESSDVVINLGGAIFSQDLTNTTTGFDIIRIDPGLSNVTIKNGNVEGATGFGIVVGQGCSDIVIDDIAVLNCDKAGIFFDGNMSQPVDDVVIKNSTIYSCTGFNGAPAYGLRMVYCENVVLENSIFNRNDAQTTNAGYGVSLEWCSSCQVVNCKAYENGGNDLGIGFYLFNSDWCVLHDCIAINNISRSATGRAVGVLLDSTDHSSLFNCLSKHNSNALSRAEGFAAYNGVDNSFNKCIAKQNVGGTQAVGFLLQTNEANSNIYKCQSRVNNGGASGIGYGILLQGAQDCEIIQNQLIGNTGSQGIGLRDTINNTTNLIAGNIAFVNTTTAFDVTRTLGLFPVITAGVGDFSLIVNTSRYLNIDFTV